jgi:hypothetical protein
MRCWIIVLAACSVACSHHSPSTPAHPRELVPVVGGVYVVDQGSLAVSVTELLDTAELDAKSAWVGTEPLRTPYVRPLGAWEAVEEVGGRHLTVRWDVELVGDEGTVTSVSGAHAIPELLGRPLTGHISNRSQEIRIAQMQQQVSAAIGACGEGQSIEVCVLVKALNNPTFRLRGRRVDGETAGRVSAAQARQLVDELRSAFPFETTTTSGPDATGAFVVNTRGSLICEVEFRSLHDAAPRFGQDRQYFLGGMATARLSQTTGRSIALVVQSGQTPPSRPLLGDYSSVDVLRRPTLVGQVSRRTR